MTRFIIFLSKNHLEHGLIHIALHQIDGAVVLAHDLAGGGEPDAGAFLLGGVERHKDLLLGSDGDELAVISDAEEPTLRR